MLLTPKALRSLLTGLRAPFLRQYQSLFGHHLCFSRSRRASDSSGDSSLRAIGIATSAFADYCLCHHGKHRCPCELGLRTEIQYWGSCGFRLSNRLGGFFLARGPARNHSRPPRFAVQCLLRNRSFVSDGHSLSPRSLVC